MPAWLKASLRPTRRAKAFGPTIPSVMAATAGGNTAADIPVSACMAATRNTCGRTGSATEPRVTVAVATMTTARLARVRSINAPAGVWATMAAMPVIDITRPMDAWSQCWTVKR